MLHIYHTYTKMNSKSFQIKRKEKYDYNSRNFSAITIKIDKLG